MNITKLKAQLKAAQKANEKKIAAAAEANSLTAQLKLESSVSLFNAKVALATVGTQTQMLQTLVDECGALVDATPVHNNKTKANRKWSGSRRFQFGSQIDLMYQLATGILYACAEHKQLLLAHTGLSLELLEQVVESFGTPTYYSRNFNSIVEAKPYNVERACATVEVMQSELAVVVDTSNLDLANFSLEFGKSEKTAHDNFKSAEEAIAQADLELQ